MEDLTLAGQQAITSVMGPSDTTTLRQITELINELYSTIQQAHDDGNNDSLLQKLADINNRLIEKADKVSEFTKQLETAKDKLTAITDLDDSIAARLTAARRIFERSLEIVSNLTTKISKADKKIDRCNQRIDSLDADEENSDTDDGEELKKLQTKRDNLTKERKYLQQHLFEHFDETLGGMSNTSKQDKRTLDLPKTLDTVAARTIIDAVKAYLGHRAGEYYAVLPYLNYVMSSYNPRDGTYYQPPSKAEKYIHVPEQLREAYGKQSELLYREILTCIKQPEMVKITTTFTYGLNKDKKARCTVDDGCMALFCLLSKYGKNDAHSLTDLEAHFTSAPHHFSFGSPATKVAILRPYLEQVLELGIQLKASQTIIPIMETLSDRHNRFAVALNEYANGGSTPNDCAATLEQMFSTIETTCERIERATGGQHIWHAQTQANSATFSHRLGKGGKGKGGKGKGKGGKGERQTHRAYETTHSHKGKGSKGGKGKGKGTHQPGYGMCWANNCSSKSGPFRFCTEHFKQGMEQGYITCYNGYKQEIKRGNRDNKDKKDKDKDKSNTYGFSKSNLQGMAAMGQHMMAQTANMIQESMNKSGDTNTTYAHQVDPFATTGNPPITTTAPTPPARTPVFKRLGEANQTESNRKRQKFIDELAQFEE
jgi:exonuclease VII small subunit